MRVFLVLILLAPCLAFAQSELVTGAATTTEVYEKVAEAASFLSTTGEAGIKEFQKPNGKFVWKNTHVEVTKCIDNYCLPGPKSKDVGLSFSRLKCYITGKFYILDLCNEAMHNPKGAWIEYWHPRAGFDQPQRRVSFMMPAANTDYQVVSSVYDNSTTLEELNKISNR
jgi:cytochrome c